MRYFVFLLCSCLCIAPLHSDAQSQAAIKSEKRWLKHHISILSSPSMQGRGYVNNGHQKAAKYILRKFKEYGLQPVSTDSTYEQGYFFPVNTFPDIVSLELNRKQLSAGNDFLVDAASLSYTAKKERVKTVDLNKIKDTAQWEQEKASWHTYNHIYLLKNADSLAKRLHIRLWHLPKEMPEGCYIIPQHGKLTWTVATETIPSTVFYVEDTVMPKHVRRTSVAVHALYLPAGKNKNENIIACVPGTAVPDSFIVFSAHYDHLGRMGEGAYFPGASDNASGTSMLLYMANYFAKHPQRYTMVFMAFSGEEAGLIGSHYFVQHPMIPLNHIRFLTNLDIMGDATNGVTVVNATEFPKQFKLLQDLNYKKGFLPQIKSRGKAANSDHYYFTEAGVPSFFLYSMGGPGYYHDVFDRSESISLTNIPALSNLLIDFAEAMNK